MTTPLKADKSSDTSALPESLQTPTITVEEMNRPPARQAAPPQWQAAPTPAAYIPPPVTSVQPVGQTAIFVQAGAFSMEDNAARLRQKLSGIAPVVVESMTNSAGRALWRVKLGPLSSVSEADRVLEQVIGIGQADARVVRGN